MLLLSASKYLTKCLSLEVMCNHVFKKSHCLPIHKFSSIYNAEVQVIFHMLMITINNSQLSSCLRTFQIYV